MATPSSLPLDRTVHAINTREDPANEMYYNGLQLIATRAAHGKIDDQHPTRR